MLSSKGLNGKNGQKEGRETGSAVKKVGGKEEWINKWIWKGVQSYNLMLTLTWLKGNYLEGKRIYSVYDMLKFL